MPAATERPNLPTEAVSALGMPALGLAQAARFWKFDAEWLLGACEQGALPFWVADKNVGLPRMSATPDAARWFFAADLSAKTIRNHIKADLLWLAQISASESDLTRDWIGYQQRGGKQTSVAAIAEWCRCAYPHPYTATPSLFAMWCSDHDWPPAITVIRHQVVSDWFEMLRDEGVAELAQRTPASATAVSVAAA